MHGFIQLIDKKTNHVLQQRVGEPSHVEYCSQYAWRVDPTVKVIFTEESDFAQPYKFMRPVQRDTIINIYAEYLDDTAPTDLEPTWKGKAFELEEMDMSAHDVAGNTWNAFTDDGEWIGTSEY